MLHVNDCFLDIKEIHIAHEYILDRVHKCEYPHGRGTYGLIYALEGKAEYCFFTGDHITVCQGDALFISPATAYSILTEKAFRHYTVNFDLHQTSSQLNGLHRPYCLLQAKNTEQLERLLKTLVSIWSAKKSGYAMQAVGRLYEVLSLFYAGYIDRQHPSFGQRLLPAKEYIDQNFDRPISLAHLAFLSDMSITNFRREWKKISSLPPLRYRDSVRFEYAKEYLSCGYYTIAEIAEKCGFEDVSYFVRFFKKQAGITPGEFKKQFLGK